jgi:DNA-directed RNA polymerase subunit RPC12/RpoP
MTLIIKYPCGHNNKFISRIEIDKFYRCKECGKKYIGREIIEKAEIS